MSSQDSGRQHAAQIGAFPERDWIGISTTLASGVTIGFIVGWALRGRGRMFGMFKPLRIVAVVGKYLAAHGTVPQTKLVLVVRSDLMMTKGKIAAQCSHAAVGAVQEFSSAEKDLLDLWLATGQTKVALKVNGSQELLALADKAQSLGVNAYIVQDSGRTQVESGTVTVVAIGPAELKRVDQITGSLGLLW